MRRGIVEKFDNERVMIQRLLNDAPLNTLAPPVNQANLAQAGRVRFANVLIDDRTDVFWRKSMKIEARFDRNAEGILIFHVEQAFRIER